MAHGDARIRREVYAFDVHVRIRVRVGNSREALAEREMVRSHLEKIAAFTRRKLGIEIKALKWTEPEHVRHEIVTIKEAM